MELNLKTYAAAIVGATVMVLLVSSVLIPISDAQTYNYYSNRSNVSEMLDLVDGDEEYKIELIDGEFTYNGGSAADYKVYTSQGWVYFNHAYATGRLTYGDITSVSMTNIATSNGTGITKLILSADSMEVTTSTGTETIAYDWAFITSVSGQYGLLSVSATSFYCGPDSFDVYSLKRFDSGYLGTVEGNTAIYRTYDLQDFLEYTSSDDGTRVVSTPIQVSPDWSVSTPIVKLDIQSNKLTSPMYVLITLIPMLVLAGIIVGVVGVFISRRD